MAVCRSSGNCGPRLRARLIRERLFGTVSDGFFALIGGTIRDVVG